MTVCKRCQDQEAIHPGKDGGVCGDCLNEPKTVDLGTVESWTYLENSHILQLSTSEGAKVRVTVSKRERASELAEDWVGEQVLDLGDQWELPDREGRRFYHE